MAALILALNLTPITNNDLFLHLRTGALVLETGRVPRVDDYSALAAGRPFIAHEWLAGVVFRLVEVADGGFGLNALIFLKCAIALAIAIALYRAGRLDGRGAPLPGAGDDPGGGAVPGAAAHFRLADARARARRPGAPRGADAIRPV